MGKWAFLVGLVLAVVAAFVNLGWLPWLVGGLGVIAGFLNVTSTETKIFLIAATGLTVALMAIQAQHYNPAWLTDVVFYVKVFVSHALLIVAFLSVLKTAKD
jgi:hypothetical protein